jgi:hypothetical protein
MCYYHWIRQLRPGRFEVMRLYQEHNCLNKLKDDHNTAHPVQPGNQPINQPINKQVAA